MSELFAVKQLEWATPHGSMTLQRAETCIGTYRSWTHHEAEGKWFWELADLGGRTVHGGEGLSEAEVQGAAQSDFATRIRSAISTGGVVEGQSVTALKLAALDITPYLRWTIGDESPGHHPTMPSAVGAFMTAFGWGTEEKYQAYRLAVLRGEISLPTPDRVSVSRDGEADELRDRLLGLADRVEFTDVGGVRYVRSALNKASVAVVASELRSLAALAVPREACEVSDAMVERCLDAEVFPGFTVRRLMNTGGYSSSIVRTILEASLSHSSTGGEAANA